MMKEIARISLEPNQASSDDLWQAIRKTIRDIGDQSGFSVASEDTLHATASSVAEAIELRREFEAIRIVKIADDEEFDSEENSIQRVSQNQHKLHLKFISSGSRDLGEVREDVIAFLKHLSGCHVDQIALIAVSQTPPSAVRFSFLDDWQSKMNAWSGWNPPSLASKVKKDERS